MHMYHLTFESLDEIPAKSRVLYCGVVYYVIQNGVDF